VTLAIRFLPVFSKELKDIAVIRKMRGVNVSWKIFMSREAINSILIPSIIRAVKSANELSLSAQKQGVWCASEEDLS